jgi:hypothetical protein
MIFAFRRRSARLAALGVLRSLLFAFIVFVDAPDSRAEEGLARCANAFPENNIELAP